MKLHGFTLQTNEIILFESPSAVITNQRLLANWKGHGNSKPKNKILLEDISGYERVVGGEDSSANKGLNILATGVIGILVALIPFLPNFLETLIFLFSMIATIFGIHLIVQSLIRLKPHTTLLFEVGAKLIPVSFPGHENPAADEFIREFNKAKSDNPPHV